MHTSFAGGAPIGERLADIDSETGPEGEGSLGTGPETALVLFALGTAAPAGVGEILF